MSKSLESTIADEDHLVLLAFLCPGCADTFSQASGNGYAFKRPVEAQRCLTPSPIRLHLVPGVVLASFLSCVVAWSGACRDAAGRWLQCRKPADRLGMFDGLAS